MNYVISDYVISIVDCMHEPNGQEKQRGKWGGGGGEATYRTDSLSGPDIYGGCKGEGVYISLFFSEKKKKKKLGEPCRPPSSFC